jgi:dTDP-4-dehydrorhamnose 3,5-epimerase
MNSLTMLNFFSQSISGLYLVENFTAVDSRGTFIKTIHEQKLEEIGFNDKFRESYYSLSHKDVIRGMHFQTQPCDHEKLVYVTSGQILDVILDLRKDSKTYGECVAIELNQFKNSVFIPRGCAHGFLTLSPEATVIYNVSTVYNSDADSGILWDSFGFNWPVVNPILSERDKSFMPLNDYNSSFL